MKDSKTIASTLAMLALLLGIGVAGHYFSPLLLPKADVQARPNPACDLQRQACAAPLTDGGQVELSIVPHPIPILTPLKIEVAINGVKAHKVEIDFAGETMNMGYNRVALNPADGNRFVGEGSLPVCVSGGMAWVATVLIETDRQRIAVPYRFSIGY